MIIKIDRLKNFGIFQDFSWKPEIPEFKKFNLVYGWNRSGKTTISRLFASCEKKSTYDAEKYKQYYENGEFKITTSEGTIITNTNVAENILSVKVFNQDFINDNISFESSDSCKPIIYVSEEDIESKKRLTLLNEDKTKLEKAFEEAKYTKAIKDGAKSSFLTGLGREIANILFDKSYNKTKAESKINSIGIDNFKDKMLSDEDKIRYGTISKSEPEKEQTILKELSEVNFEYLHQRVKSLLDKKIVAELLERLKDPNDADGGLDEELNSWVKQGFDIHLQKKQFKFCLFCENELKGNFFDTLTKHFSRDYLDLQESIMFLIDDLKKYKLSPITEKNVELYKDLRTEYETQSKKYNAVITKSNNWLDHSDTWLNQKYKNPFDPDIPEMVDSPENYSIQLNAIINELNSIILKHNDRVKNHASEVQSAREKLELNSIAVALSTQDYKKLLSELTEADSKFNSTLEAVNKIISEISELERNTSNIGIAINEINLHLQAFFGRKEIELELDVDKIGYIIKREGQQAKNLSEGEKTAIAFSYFIVKAKEKEFKIKDSIIFIDDPISSFDTNFIYHSFSLVKNHFNEAGQLFISTHNFQFFNLVKDWFTKKNKNVLEQNKERLLKEKSEKPFPCEFYMVKNDTGIHGRTARIVELDGTLKSNRSEYTFLFRLLNEFNNQTEDPSFEEIYNISNIGRRFFDLYADFKIPTNSLEQREKIDAIVKQINKGKPEENKINSVACDKVFWLINGFSHNSDPLSTIQHTDKSESLEAIKILLNIVKESDPEHFKVLEKDLV